MRKQESATSIKRLFFLLFALGFITAISPTLYRGLREVFFYQSAEGMVLDSMPPDRLMKGDLAEGQIVYSFTINDHVIQNQCPPDHSIDMPRRDYSILQRNLKPGELLTVYYDPSDPSFSTLEPRIEPFPLFVLIFLMPFLAIGLGPWVPKIGDWTQVTTIDGGKMQIAGKTGSFVILALLSGISAFGVMMLALSPMVDSFTAVILALLTLTIFVPGTSWLIHHWILGRKERPQRLYSFGNTLSKKESIRKGVGQEKRAKFAVLAFVSLFWWSGVGLFLVHAISPLWLCREAQNTYVATEGKILRNVLLDPKHHDRQDGEGWVEYEFKVDEKIHLGYRALFGEKIAPGDKLQEKIAALYPVGQTVDVWYHPQDPSKSVLERQCNSSIWAVLLFMTPFVLGGFLFLYMLWAAFKDLPRRSDY